MVGTGGYHPKQNNSETERQIPNVVTYKWELNNGYTRTYRAEKQDTGDSKRWAGRRGARAEKLPTGYNVHYSGDGYTKNPDFTTCNIAM